LERNNVGAPVILTRSQYNAHLYGSTNAFNPSEGVLFYGYVCVPGKFVLSCVTFIGDKELWEIDSSGVNLSR
jgi:hypothetical protein